MKEQLNILSTKASQVLSSGAAAVSSKAAAWFPVQAAAIERYAALFSKSNRDGVRRYVKAFGVRSAVTRTVGILGRNGRYNRYVKSHSAGEKELERQAQEHFPYEPLISIIVPTYNTPWEYLVQMIESVTSQSYPGWELCIADGSPDHTLVQSVVRSYQRNHPSIHLRLLDENLGISGNTNAALDLAQGDYIALLDHDDFLTPDALYEVVRMINRHSDADVLYTDEDKYDSGFDRYYDPNLKPDFDQDYLLCCNYITHFYVVKKSIVDQTGGFSTTMDGSQDYDFILRTTEQAAGIYHIPKVLYHWRIHSNSVAGDPTSKMYAYDAAQNALNSYFQRQGIDACASKTENLGYYHANYRLQGQPLVSVMVTNCWEDTAHFEQALLESTDYDRIEFVSKWSDIKGEYVLFLDHVAKLPSGRSWLSDLLSNCQRPEIGLVSGKVLSSSTMIYEFGLVYDAEGRIVSPFYHQLTAYPGYYHLTDSQHCVSLTGGHFLLAAKTDLEEFISAKHPKKLGERFFYELSLSLREKGKKITLLPHISVTLNCEMHNTFLFYHFQEIPEYIRKNPQDPMYNNAFSAARPYMF